MNIYDFIDNFSEADLYDADKRRLMEAARVTIARMYFEDLYEEDMSEVSAIMNASYYELAQLKLEGLKV